MKAALLDLALSVGFKPEAIKKWRQRGYVPSKHRDSLLRSARRRLLPISADDLTFAGTGGTGTKRGMH